MSLCTRLKQAMSTDLPQYYSSGPPSAAVKGYPSRLSTDRGEDIGRDCLGPPSMDRMRNRPDNPLVQSRSPFAFGIRITDYERPCSLSLVTTG